MQDSDFREYFDLLPETYSCPVTWDVEEIKKLPLIISQQLLSIKSRMETVVKTLDLDREKYQWAFCSTFTRSFSGKFSLDESPSWLAKTESDDVPFNCPVIDLAKGLSNIFR